MNFKATNAASFMLFRKKGLHDPNRTQAWVNWIAIDPLPEVCQKKFWPVVILIAMAYFWRWINKYLITLKSDYTVILLT